MIHAPPENVALTTSTTDGCALVLAGLALGAEDEIVTTDVEHFGLLGPLGVSEAQVRVARVRDRPAAEAFDAIRAEVGPRTRLLALSHVVWTTGHVLPVRELKEETGLPMLVDGAQSVGAIPVRVEGFDFYTVSGQKWLCGPDAVGALYVAEPGGAAAGRGRATSPRRGSSPTAASPRAKGRRGSTRAGSPPRRSSGSRRRSSGLPDWRFERARELAGFCRERLAARFEVVTEPDQATLVSWRVEGDAAELAVRRWEQGVVIRDMPGLGWLRASCGYWTSEGDIERLLRPWANSHRLGTNASPTCADLRIRVQIGGWSAAGPVGIGPKGLVRCGGVGARSQAQLGSDRPQRRDHVADVLVELQPEQLGAGVHLVAVHARGERRLLELLPHRLRLQAVEPVGRTRPQACTKPESSSHANSICFSGVSRGIARCSACDSTASITSSGQPSSRRMGAPSCGCLSSVG